MTVPPETTPAIRMRGVTKSFGAVRANRDASLTVAQGEIHALVGENGAGKSTLMRVLAGILTPDAGVIEVADAGGTLRDVTGWNAGDAIKAGVGMVHQHFMLVPTLTVAENVVLGAEKTRGPLLDRKAAEKAVHDLVARTGLQVPADRLVSELSVGEAQRVEILKVLYRGARILVLDEPTAVLSPPEIRELWGVLRTLAAHGGTIVLITHKLDEVMDVSDRITVMRQGETVARMVTSEATPATIARAMVGRDVKLAGDAVHAGDMGGLFGEERAAALSVRNLVVAGPRNPRAVDDVSFDIGLGEIVGIAGVEGNGQSELIEAIAGIRAHTSGQILLGARDVSASDIRERSDSGVSHIPEDRHRRGLVLDWSVGDNLVFGIQHRYTKHGMLDRARIAHDANAHIKRFDIRPADASVPARALSGGNQQKIVIAREMGRPYTLLLAAQPTRGVDVGAIEFIHEQLRAARNEGKAILLVSADLSEILALSDRVAVMYRGKLVAMMPRRDADAEKLGRFMTGAGGAKVA